MSKTNPKHPGSSKHDESREKAHEPHGGKHVDTGEHAKKNQTERAHVVDEGLGMSRFDADTQQAS